jgi:hypothetical protein
MVITKVIELHVSLNFAYRNLVWFGLDFKLHAAKVGYIKIGTQFILSENFKSQNSPYFHIAGPVLSMLGSDLALGH